MKNLLLGELLNPSNGLVFTTLALKKECNLDLLVGKHVWHQSIDLAIKCSINAARHPGP